MRASRPASLAAGAPRKRRQAAALQTKPGHDSVECGSLLPLSSPTRVAVPRPRRGAACCARSPPFGICERAGRNVPLSRNRARSEYGRRLAVCVSLHQAGGSKRAESRISTFFALFAFLHYPPVEGLKRPDIVRIKLGERADFLRRNFHRSLQHKPRDAFRAWRSR
jgi:hypothetical protein